MDSTTQAWLEGLETFSTGKFQDTVVTYSACELNRILSYDAHRIVQGLEPILSPEKTNYLTKLVEDRQQEVMVKFCTTSDPALLFLVGPKQKWVLLNYAPVALGLYRGVNNLYVERALNALDILTPVAPLHFECDEFEPLQWIGASCYVDSVLMSLLAVPNRYITDTLLNVTLEALPSSKAKYPCSHSVGKKKADPETDLANREKVQGALNDIAESLRGTGDVPNCTSLRAILKACPDPERFHLPGDRDASEYLAYILRMFPETAQVKSVTTITKSSDSGKTWTIDSQTVHTNDSILYSVRAHRLLAIPKGEFVTTGSLLEESDDTVVYGKIYRTVTAVESAPYLIINALRGHPELNEDDEGFFIQSQILPTEHITFASGKMLALSAIVMWMDAHYTAYVRCGSGYYYYNDLTGAVEDPISYSEMLAREDNAEGVPDVKTNGTMYFYVDAGKIDVPVFGETSKQAAIAIVKREQNADKRRARRTKLDTHPVWQKTKGEPLTQEDKDVVMERLFGDCIESDED